MKHYTIPFFIVHRGCPGQCVFCNQKKITGNDSVLPEDIDGTIEKYLSTIPAGDKRVEAGFFGGTFTGLPLDLQKAYLDPVQKYIDRGVISGIRVSTRPDFISAGIAGFLKKNNVDCVELGVQSMSDDVLKMSKRGYSKETVETASRLITDNGIALGHQMMVGLPASTIEDEFFTARKAKELKASEVRIYPVIVMKETELADMWRREEYKPLKEEEALKRVSSLLVFFEINGIKVIRCGLHPSDGLVNHENYLDGPFHTAFRQKADSLIFSRILEKISRGKVSVKKLYYNPADAASVFGFKKENNENITKISSGEKERFREDADVPRGYLKVLTEDTEVLFGKKDIAADMLPENMRE